MAQITALTIKSMYGACVKQHGEHESIRQFAIMLLEDVANIEAAYSAASERKATEAERILAEVMGEQ